MMVPSISICSSFAMRPLGVYEVRDGARRAW
jgi:hypothetical protein